VRIRQVRPEFFTDAVVSRLPAPVRLTYIGLWCVADDAGWMTWDVPQIAAQLSPYESIRTRERRLNLAGEALRDTGRLVFYECGCAHVPKLEEHQRIGGNKSYTARDEHRVHTRTDKSKHEKLGKPTDEARSNAENREVHTSLDKSAVTLGNGRVGNVSTGASARDDDEYKAAVLKAQRRQGLPVDVAS